MTRTRLLIIATIASVFLWCFGSVLFNGRSFGFRDAANYYYPLFEWECDEWRAGRLPLWNPLDNGGSPVLADTTSSVLYPGKFVFALPGSFRLRYHIYVTTHVLLAAGMAYRLARHWHCSLEASGLAAISYAFGGSVLFQYCNVVFLIGAAWLPLGLLAADRMLHERSFGWALTLGVTLALMVLGGDPQAAYHTGMLSAFYALLLLLEPRTDAQSTPVTWKNCRPALLAVAAISGICLSLVQVLPATEWASQSNRRSYDAPRNIYEAGRSIEVVRSGQELAGDIATGFFGPPPRDSHLRHVYEFSVGPWHLAEFVWPNFFGRTFPENERWSTAFPGEGRTWTPSLYVGLLPFVLALLTWRVRKTKVRVRFVSLLTLLAILGSFGWYGIGWLMLELQAAVSGQTPDGLFIGEPVGGLYWLFIVLLPRYVYFRYPAKLLVIASLGISLLAARGWDELLAVRSRVISGVFVVIAASSLAVAAGFGMFQQPWKVWLANAAPDSIFGPLNVDAATNRVLLALLQTAVLGMAYWFLLRATSARVRPMRGILFLMITALELGVANGWMTLSIPGEVWSERQPLVENIERSDHDDVPFRLFRDSAATLVPEAWSTSSDATRLAEVVTWERATLLPKHHLQSGVAIIGSHTTLTAADWRSFLRVAREWDRSHATQQRGSLLDSMSVQFIATRTSEDLKFVANPLAFPRAWIVRETEILPPLADHRSRQAIDQRTRDVFFEDGEHLRDLRSIAILESDDAQRLPKFPKHWKSASEDSCEITHYSPSRVEIEVDISKHGCLVLNDSFYIGWHAVRETNGVSTNLTIHRANRLMRAVVLPAGRHRVVYTYRPARFTFGGWISGIAWLLTIGVGTRGFMFRNRSESVTARQI